MNHQPHIIFAGAGPGDPSLVTMKLVDCLSTSECILIDRLVNPEIISRYAPASAEIIFVGKQCYQDASTDQSRINQWLIEKAQQGRKTIRLKGGDVAIYSNVLDEIQAISAKGITYEIIPGITAASGAAASLGVGLTGRGIAPGVRFLSMSVSNLPSGKDFEQWAQTTDTLIFYMTAATLRILAKKLLDHGADPAKYIVIIEDATTSTQQNTFYTLSTLVNDTGDLVFRSPSIVIIGDIMKYASRKMKTGSNEIHSIFEPIDSTTKNTDIHVI